MLWYVPGSMLGNLEAGKEMLHAITKKYFTTAAASAGRILAAAGGKLCSGSAEREDSNKQHRGRISRLGSV
jgi:hypothetical protein